MVEPLMWDCDGCGKPFPAEPDCMVEVFLEVDHEGADHRPSMSEEDKQRAAEEIGVTVEEINRTLAGGEVAQGAMCLCHRCQDTGDF